MSDTNPTENSEKRTSLIPFQSIGLCFSGGGYRATSFSLGVLSYLNRIQLNGEPLIRHVEALSSVSGGTLTAVAFASAEQAGQPFEDFYRGFFDFLNEDKLLGQATDNMKDNALWKNNHKRRSFINSFSIAYEQLFFKGKMDEFIKENPNTNLKDVCFNSTEFSFGLAFRFQNTGDPGNYRLTNDPLKAIWGEIKLADCVASSSCFPVGFAPMIMPDDYFEDQKRPEYLAVKKRGFFEEGIGVLDGGIVDNQGIGSMVLIDKRRNSEDRKDRNLDLFMICDVGSYKMTPWQMDNSDKKSGQSIRAKVLNLLKKLNLRWWQWAPVVIGVLMLLLNRLPLFSGMPWANWNIVGGVLTGAGVVLTVVGAALGAAKSWVVDTARFAFSENVPKPIAEDLRGLEKLDVGLIKRMVTERISSGLTMVNDVFLKQIRRLNYDLIYSQKNYENRIITATVYELNGQQTTDKKGEGDERIAPPSDRLKAIGLVASETPTTLWWDAEDRKVNRLQSLVACGEFTACYNLLDYLLKLKKAGEIGNEFDDMQKALEADWKHFNEDPFFMVNSRQSL